MSVGPWKKRFHGPHSGPPGKRNARATKVYNPEGKLNVRVYMVLTSTNDQGQEEVLVSCDGCRWAG